VDPRYEADFTLPAGRIVVMGDTRPRDYLEFFLENTRDIPERMFRAATEERPVAVIHCGDIAVYGSRKSFWQGWKGFDRHARALLDSGIPIFPAIGNHEYRGFTREPLRQYFERFPHLANRRWYTVRSGSTLFLMLDSNFDRLGEARANAQEMWVRDVLAWCRTEPSISMVIAVFHHPPFTNIARRYLVFESKAVQRRWVPWLLEHPKIVAAFAGHVHTYEHFIVQRTHFVVTGGAGSPRFHLRELRRCARADCFTSLSTLRPFHYLRLVPDDDGFRAEVVILQDDSWSVADAFGISPGQKLAAST
jgi:hypothetical protein